ncbi:hypothetical protein FB451DRAFT_1575413 [Mycena latifolia]|nr:hypothetical protein FB451DRAFT_1575413 [Mycena latifolia]
MQHSSSPSPPSTPRPLDELLSIAQQLTPSKSPRSVRRLRQQLQLQANDAQQQHVNLKRRAVDAEQQLDRTRKPRKMRKRGDRARDADDSEVNPQAIETRIRDAGRCFAIRTALFLIDDEVMNMEEDENFDAAHEFDSTESERQGQLRDILAVLPDKLKPKISQSWVQDSFLDGLHGQRSSIHHRLRTEALHVIVDDEKAFETSTSRFDTFSQLIGYKPATDSSQAFYDRFEVPILYDQWDGKIEVNKLFRGNRLLEIYASIIRGPRGAVGLFEGKSKLPQAKCLERIHHIKCITPGAIVIAAILAIWLFSADTQLVTVGDETAIDYGFRARIYTRRIRQGLRDKKTWAIGLLEHWNRIFFPNADKVCDCDVGENMQPEDDEELDNIFSQAPSAVEPQAGSDDEDSSHRSPRNSSPSPRSQRPHHSSPPSRLQSPVLDPLRWRYNPFWIFPTLHTSLWTSGTSSATKTLMSFSALFDVHGYEAPVPGSFGPLFNRQTVQEIEKEYPRGKLAHDNYEIMGREFALKPDCLASHYPGGREALFKSIQVGPLVPVDA